MLKNEKVKEGGVKRRNAISSGQTCDWRRSSMTRVPLAP
jgi:hypothetical protein